MRIGLARGGVWVLVLAGILALSCGSPEATAQTKAREYTQRFYDGELVGLHQLFTPEMAQEIPLSQFTEMHRSVEQQLGRETEVLSESIDVKSPYHRYIRRARFERYVGEVEISWLLREDDHSIAGVVFRLVEKPEGG